jgi:demethylmenaquinone methyltransferase / 2-methoxy-6-polyprenyl-1,4-benzoquinol methylase
MANRYFVPGTERAKKVETLFNRIARRYDLINDVQSFGLHRYWKRRLVRLAGIRPGETVLDLCCGTGDLAGAIEKEGAKVIGTDFSGPMLEMGRQRMAERVRFIQGDALSLPFKSGVFDAVTIGYGLRNLADLEEGLREILRVTKRGGRILALDFGKPDNRVWRKIYFAYLRVCVPVFGRLFCGDEEAYGYILESLRHYPGQNGVRRLMTQLGGGETEAIPLLWGVMSINYGRKNGDRSDQSDESDESDPSDQSDQSDQSDRSDRSDGESKKKPVPSEGNGL